MKAKIEYPFCSIVVLNYFGEKIIGKNLIALLSLKYPKNRYEIIVIDNGSKDKSREIINGFTKKYVNIKKKFLNENLGFSAGNNVGIKSAKGKYVALLNNDAFPDKNWLKELVRVAEGDKRIFAVTSKILITDNVKSPTKPEKRVIQNAGSIVFQDGYGRDIGAVINYNGQIYEQDLGQYDKKREVYAVCGAACLFKKEALEKLGYLDESFFFYYEDTEISERARFAGYKLIYTPKAIVYHLHAYSSGEWSPFFIYNAERGRLLHVFYNFPAIIFIKEYAKFTAETFGRLLGIKGLSVIPRMAKLILHALLIIPAIYKIFRPDKKFIKKLKVNIQYIKVSLYFFFNWPKLLIYRLKKYPNSHGKAIWQNYQNIISGKWYFS